VDSYEILFHRATGNQQLGDCTSFEHSGNVSVDGNITMYNVTGLQEFSTYIITVTAVINVRGRSQNSPITVNTQMAGMLNDLDHSEVANQNIELCNQGCHSMGTVSIYVQFYDIHKCRFLFFNLIM